MANPQVLDVIIEPRYDTSFIPTAGTTQIVFFQTQQGAGVSSFNTAATKTPADTNMQLAGQLAAGYNFTVLGFRLLPTFNMTVADATLALNGAWFTFRIGSKDYLTIPARTIPAGMGPVSALTTVASHGWPMISNGYAITQNMLELAQSQNFSGSLQWSGAGQAVTTSLAALTTAGAAGLPITCLLDGILKRLPQ